MEISHEDRILFSKESTNTRIERVIVRELKILDQYSKAYKKSIKEHNTPKSICGYIVSAVGPLIAQAIPYKAKMSQVESLVKSLNEPTVMIQEVEKCMEIIQAQRSHYLQQNANDFKTKKSRDSYITDWVAKYEISDLMQIFGSDYENLFFLRYVGFEFPELVKDVKHEEKRRIVEEERFKGDRFIIESFHKTRKLQSLEQWIYEGKGKRLRDSNKPLVFIADLLGHFVTFFACKIKRENGVEESTLFLLNSVSENHMKVQEVVFTICQLAFPEDIFVSNS